MWEGLLEILSYENTLKEEDRILWKDKDKKQEETHNSGSNKDRGKK